jgi:MIP family channel proteins
MRDKVWRLEVTGRSVLAEVLATMFFVYIGGWGAINSTLPNFSGMTDIDCSIATPAILAVMIMLTFNLSGGQINPAVSIGLAVAGKQTWKEAFIYSFSQFFGSVLGATMLYFSASVYGDPANFNLSYPTLNPLYSRWSHFFVEFIATFFLMFGILSIVNRKGSKFEVAFVVFGTLCAAINTWGGITGASLNPARDFGPNMVSSTFNSPGWWVYYLGPVAGACFAAFSQEVFIQGKNFRDYVYWPVVFDTIGGKLKTWFKRSK